MSTTTASSKALYEQALSRREAELRAVLFSASQPAAGVDESEVSDFKDIAAVDAQSEVDEARISQVEQELAQVAAARTRLAEGAYGACQECGAAISHERLLSLPEAAYCTGCQAAREHGRHRHS